MNSSIWASNLCLTASLRLKCVDGVTEKSLKEPRSHVHIEKERRCFRTFRSPLPDWIYRDRAAYVRKPNSTLVLIFSSSGHPLWTLSFLGGLASSSLILRKVRAKLNFKNANIRDGIIGIWTNPRYNTRQFSVPHCQPYIRREISRIRRATWSRCRKWWLDGALLG